MNNFSGGVNVNESMMEVVKFIDLTPSVSIAILLLMFVLLFHFVITWKRHTIKREYKRQSLEVKGSLELSNLTYDYNSKAQKLEVLRYGVFFIFGFSLLAVFNIALASYLAVAFGALLVVFKEAILSLISSFYVLAHYKVGTHVRVALPTQEIGEIVRITPFFVHLKGKDDKGEFSGKLINIPNYIFLTSGVEEMRLAITDTELNTLEVVYEKEVYNKPFEQFYYELEEFLHDRVKKRKSLDLGNYTRFAGKHFKIRHSYNAEGAPVLQILFLDRFDKGEEVKFDIMSYIEANHKK